MSLLNILKGLSSLESEISPEHISFLKERGTPYRTKPIKYVPRGTLDELANSNDSEVARTTKSLLDIIKKNESNLMKDEKEIAKSFGFKTNTNFAQIRYSLQTGRVSVYWTTSTSGSHEAMKWGIVCPPNDVRKRNAVKEWIQKNPRKVLKAKHDLDTKQLPYDE